MRAKLRLVICWVTVMGVGLGVVNVAEAGSIMISDGASTLTITDQDFIADPNAPADLGTAQGLVVFIGSLGTWQFTLTSGLTKPLLGSATAPSMELRDVSLSSSRSGGELTIWFSETGFGPTGTVATSTISGLSGGSIAYETFQGVNLFQETTSLASLSYGSGAFAGSYSGVLANSTGPYSLTQQVTITHAGGVVGSSFRANLSVASVPDGGMTLSLLGLALVGMAAFRRALPLR